MATGCTISDNSAAYAGGGIDNIYNSEAATVLTLTNCVVSGNTAGAGGGVNNSGTATITDCMITDNSSISPGGGYGDGAGLQNSGTVSLTDCTISGNTGATQGGGLANQGAALLAGCTVSDNFATGGDGVGGGISDLGASLSLTECTISNNVAAFEGGGIFANGQTSDTLTDCTISGNNAFNGGGLGGAAYMTNCTIYGNSALYYGGGIDNDGTGKSGSLTACTVSGNSAGKQGGGVYVLRLGDYPLTLTDTIVAGNTGHLGAASDIFNAGSTTISGTYNLIGTGGSGGISSGSSGNMVLTSLSNLDLGPLTTNGGQTDTMALLSGSVAIHAGIAASGVSTDQRGLPLDSPPDIGAYQVQPAVPLYTVTTTADSGSGSLRCAIAQADAGDVPAIIEFAIGTGQQTIDVLSPLPSITVPLTIDGMSQPGYIGTPLIEINGANAGSAPAVW